MENLHQKTFDLLEKTGLNWTVTKEPLMGSKGQQTESFGIFKEGSTWLGTVGNVYKPFQNFELAETLLEATSNLDNPLERGGMLMGGKKVFFQAALPDEYIGKTDVKRYISALNSHNGSTSVSFGSSNTCVICDNTFHKVYSETEKFRHTENMVARIELAIENLKRSIDLDNQLMTNFKRMADMEVKDEAIERVIRSIFKVDPSSSTSEISTRKQNQVIKLANSIEKEFALEGKTIWGLFNGVTRYTNHEITYKDADRKADSLMIPGGRGYAISNLAFDDLMAFVEEHTASTVFAI